jgi:hypothetical protein
MNLIRPLTVSGLLLATLTSCATPTKYPETDANGKKIEYVWYTPVGSNLPIKVRKDQLPTSDDDAAVMDKELGDIQRGTSGPMKDPASGK